jgi:hypothetical protein
VIAVSLVAAAADLCLKPHRFAVVLQAPAPDGVGRSGEVLDPDEDDEWALLLQARDGGGRRLPEEDLELEIYRSGVRHNLMLCRCRPLGHPLLWHGGHPVWMDGTSGERCERPAGGERLEALARRLHALL